MGGRIILIVLDSVGIGELPDAALYQDQGSNTLGNIVETLGSLELPILDQLGLGQLLNLRYQVPKEIVGCYGKMGSKSAGKDTTTGHWELAGVVLETPFPLYPHGFPPDVIEEFERRSGHKTIGNFPASGTEIIKQLGEEHIRTGNPIVYTSADSVFQVACHEEKFGLAELYRVCKIAREMLVGPHGVGRVIARPFIGANKNDFKRTSNRRDFSLSPPPTILDFLKENNFFVIGIGKIEDIFANRGLTQSSHAKNNQQVLESILEFMSKTQKSAGLIFANLVDFDMLYGHRNDVAGYAKALQQADLGIGKVLAQLLPDDLLIITADHGCDPTTPSTDHSREYVPLLVYGQNMKKNVNLGIRATFADVGQTIAAYFGVKPLQHGTSFLEQVRV